MIQIIRVHHITIASPKKLEKQMLHFYVDLLGFKLLDLPSHLSTESKKVVWLDRNGIRLHLNFLDEVTRAGLERHVALEVKDISAIRKFFNANHVTIEEDVEVPYCTRFDIVDPAGNYIEILELK